MAASETKRRLLLSKWYGEIQKCREIESVYAEELRERDTKIENLESELEDARDEIEKLEAGQDARDDELTAALIEVRYWLHDGLVHGKLVSDPRRMLRKIEEALQ